MSKREINQWIVDQVQPAYCKRLVFLSGILQRALTDVQCSLVLQSRKPSALQVLVLDHEYIYACMHLDQCLVYSYNPIPNWCLPRWSLSVVVLNTVINTLSAGLMLVTPLYLLTRSTSFSMLMILLRRLKAWVQYFYHVFWPEPCLLLDMKTHAGKSIEKLLYMSAPTIYLSLDHT